MPDEQKSQGGTLCAAVLGDKTRLAPTQHKSRPVRQSSHSRVFWHLVKTEHWIQSSFVPVFGMKSGFVHLV